MPMNAPALTIRPAEERDAGLLFRFILKMAHYEKLEHEVDT